MFEADLCSTADNVQVLRHDWNSTFDSTLKKGIAPTFDEFLNSSVYGSYSPMSLWNLFEYMEKNPDIWIITDSKNTEYDEVVEQFQTIVSMAEKHSQKELLNRLIIQIYNDEMLDAVKSVYPFEHFIYTCYIRGTSNMDELIRFCSENNIPVITVPTWNWNNDHAARKALQNSDMKVFVHTINDTAEMETYLNQGVWGFYTDYVTPSIFRSLLNE